MRPNWPKLLLDTLAEFSPVLIQRRCIMRHFHMSRTRVSHSFPRLLFGPYSCSPGEEDTAMESLSNSLRDPSFFSPPPTFTSASIYSFGRCSLRTRHRAAEAWDIESGISSMARYSSGAAFHPPHVRDFTNCRRKHTSLAPLSFLILYGLLPSATHLPISFWAHFVSPRNILNTKPKELPLNRSLGPAA